GDVEIVAVDGREAEVGFSSGGDPAWEELHIDVIGAFDAFEVEGSLEALDMEGGLRGGGSAADAACGETQQLLRGHGRTRGAAPQRRTRLRRWRQGRWRRSPSRPRSY